MLTWYNIIHGPEAYVALSVWAFGAACAILFVWYVSGFDKTKEENISNLQLIEALCAIVEQLVKLVKHLAGKLEQIDALDAADRDAIAEALEQYSTTLGADEIDDEKDTSGLLTEE